MKITDEQFQALKRLRDAVREVHALFPGNRDVARIHGAADRAVTNNRDMMTDDQVQALGGGSKDPAPSVTEA